VRRTQIREGTGITAIQEVIDVKETRSRQLMSQSETSEYIFETQKLKDLNPPPLDTVISTTEESGVRKHCQDTSEKQSCFGEASNIHRAPKASAPASLSAKNRRQIRAIQKAINQEIQGGSKKRRSRVLSGLEEALKKLESDR
jgi:hypothetical protein